jgi:hypothetical protein
MPPKTDLQMAGRPTPKLDAQAELVVRVHKKAVQVCNV